MKNPIRAIIFDLDGVLVDATEWHFESLNKALLLFGYQITREEHKTIYNGLPTVEKLHLLTKRKGLPMGLHPFIHTLKRQYTDEKVILHCKPYYEKIIMLKTLKQAGFKLGVCSNAQKYSVMSMLTRSHLDGFFEVILGNDEGYKPKPSPEIYKAIFKKMLIRPEQALIIEDAPYGVRAAKESGARVLEVKGFLDVNLSLFTKVLNIV